MRKEVKAFLTDFDEVTRVLFGKGAENCGTFEKYTALAKLVGGYAAEIRSHTLNLRRQKKERKVFYFSMEFLIGRLLKCYLADLGLLDAACDGLRVLGEDPEEIFACERDPGLGNGGLGRLAACYMDAMAAGNVNAVGMGIRYRYGLFRQKIFNGWQEEEPDDWLTDGYPWETRKPDESVTVYFGGSVERLPDGRRRLNTDGAAAIRAVPYDVPVIGYGGETVNVLRLWSSQPYHEAFDLPAFNRGDYAAAVRQRSEAEAISCVLYPEDSGMAGKELRLKQEYFFSAAGVADILRQFKSNFGTNWKIFTERVAIHVNDTHPTLCIPELMRLLMDEEGLGWDEAWEITRKTVSYTNHTVMPEALEKWPIPLISRLLPRIYMIIEEIDRRWRLALDPALPDREELLKKTAILWDGEAKMANLSVIGSSSVNGVAALHTEILKRDTLKEFYLLQPEKFRNVTNGISHRRFMAVANPELAALLDETVAGDWRKDASLLAGLEQYAEDKAVLSKLLDAKRAGKKRLAEYIARTNQIEVDPDSVFDIQVKRIHAYKRQLLSVFKILTVYDELKAHPERELPPVTFILAGKAAAGYAFAKESIKLCCAAADLVNGDPAMRGRMKVIFLENFSVSVGQLIYPAADLSEQISTAGKEASGTGCMKFMMNGAVTLGTLDGANVEIRELVGDDNMFLFGLTAPEADELRRNGSYRPQEILDADERLRRIFCRLRDGSLGYRFERVISALTTEGDEYFVLRDYASYMEAWEKAIKAWQDPALRARMSLINVARSGKFSADRSIRDYQASVWNEKN